MPTTIDDLNDLDPLNMTKENIDELILAHRRNREAGPKRAKKELGPNEKIDLAGLGLVKKAEPVKVVRRI